MMRRKVAWIPVAMVAVLGGCASAQVAQSAGGDELTEAGSEGDEQLDGDDYLVQISSKEYRVGKLKSKGPVRGIVPFTLVSGEEVKAAAYHRTVVAQSGDVGDGVLACYFREKDKDGVFQKPASKEEARAGHWNCRAIRDVSEKSQGHVLVGEDKVALDNLRVQKKDASDGLGD